MRSSKEHTMKVTITLEDEANGDMTAQIDFDPPIDENTAETTAGRLGLEIVHLLKNKATEVSVED
jgi:hypothetical protein